MLLVVHLGRSLSLKCHFGPSLPAEKDEKLACKMSDNTEKNSSTNSLRASSPIWASEASLARTRERETRFTRPNRRACSQAIVQRDDETA